MTFGLDFGLQKSIDELTSITEDLQNVVEELRQIERSGSSAGAGISDGFEDASGAAGDLDDKLGDVQDGLEGIGNEADNTKTKVISASDEMKARFQEAMGASLQEGESFTKSLKTGISAGFDYAGKRVKSFFDTGQKKLKDFNKALKHPIQTIKTSLGKALIESSEKIRGLGDSANDTEDDLEDMGDAGEEAGSQVKDAIKGAIGAFVGFEAIQAGIDKLKELGAVAFEMAGIAESSGKKFKANFNEADAQWVDNFADSIHRSTSEVEGFMVSNKAMYGELGITGDAAKELSKITTSLAYDLGNAFSIDDTEALGVVQDYISGNSAALEEYGVHIDDTILKNTALSMGLGENIDELDDASLAQIRMTALLKESADIQKAAIEETDGIVNSTKSLKGVWTDFMAEAGLRFAPTMEGLFGTISNNWPTIEPMLLGFVDVLSNGMSQSIPILLDLGQTIIPSLTTVLGALFEAGAPLISVFGEIAGTVLPPFAQVIETLATTLLPPFTEILITLNEHVLQPLLPALEMLEPPLEFIGEMVGAIGDGLSEMIKFVSGGVGKVAGFFGDLFGGADESKEKVDDLNASVKDFSVPSGSEEFIKQQDLIVASSQKTHDEISQDQQEINDGLTELSTNASDSYRQMSEHSAQAWKKMQEDADRSSAAIINDLNGISAKMNPGSPEPIPHNASGTNNFEGGFTYMNEEGGELAFLPSGSVIVPSDRSEQLIDSIVNNIVNNDVDKKSVFAPNVIIRIEGSADESIIEKIEEILRDLFPELYRQMQEEDYSNRSLQQGFA